jgi:hypothetical protein
MTGSCVGDGSVVHATTNVMNAPLLTAFLIGAKVFMGVPPSDHANLPTSLAHCLQPDPGPCASRRSLALPGKIALA